MAASHASQLTESYPALYGILAQQSHDHAVAQGRKPAVAYMPRQEHETALASYHASPAHLAPYSGMQVMSSLAVLSAHLMELMPCDTGSAVDNSWTGPVAVMKAL